VSETAERPSHASNDYVEHNSTFAVFTTLLKWGTVGVVVILIGMAVFLL
jgi:hypothetical protein